MALFCLFFAPEEAKHSPDRNREDAVFMHLPHHAHLWISSKMGPAATTMGGASLAGVSSWPAAAVSADLPAPAAVLLYLQKDVMPGARLDQTNIVLVSSRA